MSSLFTNKKILTKTFFVRLFLFLLVLLTAFTGPWWTSFILAVILILFAGFYEAAVAGLVLDIMFADEGFSLPIGDFVFTSALLVLISFSLVLRRRIKVFGTI